MDGEGIRFMSGKADGVCRDRFLTSEEGTRFMNGKADSLCMEMNERIESQDSVCC